MHIAGEANTVNVGLAGNHARIGALTAVLIACSCTSGSTMTEASRPKDPTEAFAQGQLPKRDQDALCAMIGFSEIILVLAAPRVMAKAGRIPSRAELLKTLDSYVLVIADAKSRPESEDSLPHIGVEPNVIRLRSLIEMWEPSKNVPDELKQEARATLQVMNVKEPTEGWDNYEGESE